MKSTIEVNIYRLVAILNISILQRVIGSRQTDSESIYIEDIKNNPILKI